MFKRIIFVLFATSLCSATGAEELADPKGSYAICAASNAITASRMEPAILADAMKVVAQHNAATARELGATNNDIEQVRRAMQQAHNDGKLSWDKITNLGQSCGELP
jgi:hypothetical protein